MRVSAADLRIVLRHPSVWLGALGYFVDIYDLVLFGVVRVPSLRALGVAETDLFAVGARMLNLQMVGMLVGGFLFGWAGDRFGRLRTLFASIAIYSGANVANAFVADLRTYEALRFLAGIGLAGELGIAVTLVSESLPIAVRGLGSSVIGLAGFTGAVASVLVSGQASWRMAYGLGGALGFALLALRIRSAESPIYLETKELEAKTRETRAREDMEREARTRPAAAGASPADRTTGGRLRGRALAGLGRSFLCVIVGTPVWFVSGLFLYFAPELARSLGVRGEIDAGLAILFGYVGAIFGDVASGFLTQGLRSRKRAIGAFLAASFAFTAAFVPALRNGTSAAFYVFCALLGGANGYWALFVAFAGEQFPTRVRATAATAIPNLVRAMVLPLLAVFHFLEPRSNHHLAVMQVGLGCAVLAGIALTGLKETFRTDLREE